MGNSVLNGKLNGYNYLKNWGPSATALDGMKRWPSVSLGELLPFSESFSLSPSASPFSERFPGLSFTLVFEKSYFSGSEVTCIVFMRY